MMLLKSAKLRKVFAVLVTTGALGSASPGSYAPGDDPTPFAGELKQSKDVKAKDDIRPRVRELLQEALDAWLSAKPGFQRTRALIRCAVLQARAGDSDSARKTFGQAKETIQALPQQSQPQEWHSLAMGYAQAGEIEDLRAVIAALPDPARGFGGTPEDFRNMVLSQSATMLAKAGRSKEALELAKEITGDRYSAPEATLLRFVALYHARSGDLKEARRTLDQIANAGEKIEALAGMFYGGVRSLYLPRDPGIASIQDEAGDHGGARESLKVALEIADGIKEPPLQARGRALIACAQAQVGDLAGAGKTLEQVPAGSDLGGPRERPWSALARVALARAQAAAGHGKEAVAAVDKLSTMSLRVSGLTLVVIGLAESGDQKAARDTAESALELIDNLPEQQQQQAWSFLSEARAVAKDIPGALATAARMRNNNPGPARDTMANPAYVSIAYQQAKSGDVKGAMGTLEEHLKGWNHQQALQRALQSIGYAQAERGEVKEALTWAKELTAPEAKGYALLGVAEGMLEKAKIGVGR
jgi:hypothetical protein